ncbi:hypothetical protein ABZ653_11155, partial [Streptomyces sp. NPDC007083]
RSVSGATVTRERGDATGARSSPGHAASGRRPAQGAGGTQATPGSEHSAADQRASPSRPATLPDRPGEVEQTAPGDPADPDGTTAVKETLSSALSAATHRHRDDQQGEPHGSD